MIKNLILLLAFTSFLTSHAYSQQDTSRLYEWNGRMVKYVKIQKGKTLYSLSKETNTLQDSIIAINPELSNGLKTGMVIRIPMGFVEFQGKNESPKRNASIEHLVKAGETAFSIAKKYGLTTDELFRQNPESRAGLKVGAVLKINPKSGGKQPEKSEQQINKRLNQKLQNN